MNEKSYYPYKIIELYVQNEGFKDEIKNRDEISTDLNVNQVTNQSNLIIHQIEDSNIFRKKYP